MNFSSWDKIKFGSFFSCCRCKTNEPLNKHDLNGSRCCRRHAVALAVCLWATRTNYWGLVLVLMLRPVGLGPIPTILRSPTTKTLSENRPHAVMIYIAHRLQHFFGSLYFTSLLYFFLFSILYRYTYTLHIICICCFSFSSYIFYVVRNIIVYFDFLFIDFT